MVTEGVVHVHKDVIRLSFKVTGDIRGVKVLVVSLRVCSTATLGELRLMEVVSQ